MFITEKAVQACFKIKGLRDNVFSLSSPLPTSCFFFALTLVSTESNKKQNPTEKLASQPGRSTIGKDDSAMRVTRLPGRVYSK